MNKLNEDSRTLIAYILATKAFLKRDLRSFQQMSQAFILNQFIKYLDITSDEYIAKLKKQIEKLKEQKESFETIKKIEQLEKIKEEHQIYIKNLKKNLNGYCFGFSLCHAVMDISGKLNWWEHALIKIYNWDGDKNRLDEKFILPDSTEGKSTTLRAIFELAINIIISPKKHGLLILNVLLKVPQYDVSRVLD